MFLDDSHSPANCRISVQVATPALNLSVRFPIPDLRSDQERGPWFKKSLQKEILYLAFTDLEFKTEFIGGSTPEQIKLELTFRELIGKIECVCKRTILDNKQLLLKLTSQKDLTAPKYSKIKAHYIKSRATMSF